MKKSGQLGKKMCHCVVCILIAMTMLCACSNVLGEEEIVKEVSNNLMEDYLSSDEVIDDIEIIERKTDKDMGVDTIHCKVLSSTREVSYIKYFLATYVLNDEKEWEFDDIAAESKSEWVSIPLTAVSDTLITNSLNALAFSVDGEDWKVEELDIEKMEIIERSTLLEQNKDSVVLSVKLASDVQTAEGEVQIDYVFEEDWSVKKCDVIDQFTSSYIEEKEFNLSDEDIIKDIKVNPLMFGEPKQVFSFDDSEVSNFGVNACSSSNKGREQVLDCSFVVNKPYVSFIVDSTLKYEYSDLGKWNCTEVNTVSEINSVDTNGLIGKWEGEMSELDIGFTMVTLDMEITEIDNGTIKAILSYPHENRSCTAKGYFDDNTLWFSLDFEKWIQEPEMNRSIYEPYLQGYLSVENNVLTSIGKLNTNDFEVKRAE